MALIELLTTHGIVVHVYSSNLRFSISNRSIFIVFFLLYQSQLYDDAKNSLSLFKVKVVFFVNALVTPGRVLGETLTAGKQRVMGSRVPLPLQRKTHFLKLLLCIFLVVLSFVKKMSP